jgi:hypothetical protein
MPLTRLQGPTIAAGQSLSDGLDVSAGDPVAIIMPANWTPANLTFQASVDGLSYVDVFDFDSERIANVTPGSMVTIAPDWSRALAFLKVRSGRHDRPVVQQQDCVFAVVVKSGATEV